MAGLSFRKVTLLWLVFFSRKTNACPNAKHQNSPALSIKLAKTLPPGQYVPARKVKKRISTAFVSKNATKINA